MISLDTENILNFKVTQESLDSCVDSILSWITRGKSCRWLACINPHSYVVALSDPLFFNALHAADYLIPDGAGIVLASRLQQGNITNRITGSDIFSELHQRLDTTGGRVFFLGSTEETLSDIRARIAVDYPNIQVVGTYSPPFKPTYTQKENDEMIAAINTAQPDVLWVGMTAPKQEKWIFEHRDRLQVKFAASVGAVFDFYAGKIKRSHPFFQRLGLEWFPRLIQEPRRLFKRNFVSSPLFLFHVFFQKRGSSK